MTDADKIKHLEARVERLNNIVSDLIGHTEAHLQFPHKDTSDLTLAIIEARAALKEDEEQTK